MKNSEKPERKALRIDVVRHAPSEYKQPEWRDIKTADDIAVVEGRDEDGPRAKEKAEALVRETAEKIAATIEPGEEVAIWSSPTGRTLETARIISEVLEEKSRERGFIVRRKGVAGEYGIKIFAKLGEIEDFAHDLFLPLVAGGKVDFEGKRFIVDKAQTNPDGLDADTYYASGAFDKIPDEAKKAWPKGYAEAIGKIEKFASANGRLIEVLRRLRDTTVRKNYRVIIVTHRGPSASIVETFTAGALLGLDPAQFVALERRDGKLVATAANGREQGDSDTDVIEAFKDRHLNPER
jgi:broad specificity phosphatase PhoE